MERRTDLRVPGWAQARIVCNGKKDIAVAMNLSPQGLYIECDLELKKGDLVDVVLNIPDSQDPDLNTIVMWVSKIGSHIPDLKYRVGLHIQKMKNYTEEQFNSILDRYSKGSFERSRLERIQIVVKGHNEMRNLHPLSLFYGGCFIAASDGLPKKDEELDVSFYVPTTQEPVIYKSKVRYVIDSDNARALGIDQGFGVLFIKELSGSGNALVAFLGKNEPVF